MHEAAKRGIQTIMRAWSASVYIGATVVRKGSVDFDYVAWPTWPTILHGSAFCLGQRAVILRTLLRTLTENKLSRVLSCTTKRGLMGAIGRARCASLQTLANAIA